MSQLYTSLARLPTRRRDDWRILEAMRTFLMVGSLALVACGAVDGAPGTQGEQGPQGPPGVGVQPSIATILPRTLVLGHDADIVVLGSLTSFTGKETLDFGAGVKVTNVTPISASALGAHVHVEKTAATGPRDLNVDGKVAAKVANVVPGIDLSVTGGAATQGGVLELRAADLDPSQFFNQPHFLGGPAIDIAATTQGVTEVRYVSVIAPSTPAGPAQADLGNFGAGNLLPLYEFFSEPSALNVSARAPTPLAIGAALTGQSVVKAYDSDLYSVTTDGTAQVVTVTTTADNGSPMYPFATVFGATGLADSYLTNTLPAYLYYLSGTSTVTAPVLAMPDTYYFSIADAKMRGGAGFGFKVSATSLPATVVPEQAMPHGQSAPQSLGNWTNPMIITGTLTGDDLDAYMFAVAPPYLVYPKTYEVTIRSDIDNLEVGFALDGTALATTYISGASITPAAAPTVQKRLVSSQYAYPYSKWFVVRSGSATGARTPVGSYTISIRVAN